MGDLLSISAPRFGRARTSIGSGPDGRWRAVQAFPIEPDDLTENIPTIYGWFAEKGERWVCLYVGQTIDLRQRTRTHLATRDRRTVGRSAWSVTRDGWAVHLAWREFACDCPLDRVERDYIAYCEPLLNKSKGNPVDGRTDAHPHDELCPLREDRHARA